MQKNKALVSLVVGLGLMIIAGLIILVWGLYQKSADPNFKMFSESDDKPALVRSTPAVPPSPTEKPFPANVSIPLPQGYWIEEMEITSGRIIVHITNDTKRDRILILDADTGAVIRRIRFDTRP